MAKATPFMDSEKGQYSRLLISSKQKVKRLNLVSLTAAVVSVADLGEGARGPGPHLLVEYLQTIYKKKEMK